MMSVISLRLIFFAIRSFSMTCGVEMMMCELFQRCCRLSGGISPVNTVMVSGLMVRVFLRKSACCRTSGLVGERNNILDCFLVS